MKLRYAKPSDFYFLIYGLEKNRILESKPKKDIKARDSDKKEFWEAIKKKNIRLLEDNKKPVAFLYFRADFKLLYIYERFFWVDLVFVKENYRGKGLGRLLYKDAMKIAKKKDSKK